MAAGRVRALGPGGLVGPRVRTTWWTSAAAEQDLPTSGETILHFPEVPIFSALAASWRSQGRMVPGQRDTEWEAAARQAAPVRSVEWYPAAQAVWRAE